MGQMRFLIPQPLRLTEEAAEAAYLTGIDRIAWPCRSWIEGTQLIVERAVSDSGNLHVPWRVDRFGQTTLSTASLMERSELYVLPLELARGVLNQLRDQLFEWETIGLRISEEIREKTAQAMKHLHTAATGQDNPVACAEAAEAAICLGFEAGEMLAAAYAEQSMAIRLNGGEKLTALFGARLEEQPPEGIVGRRFVESFNTAVVPMNWRDVETRQGKFNWAAVDARILWCQTNGLTVCSGPLLSLDARSLPDWLYLWEDDFDNLFDFLSEFVTATVKRYRGKVRVWQCAAALETGDGLSLSEEDKLRLAARVVELVGELDPDAPTVLCFEQPWTEYASRRNVTFPPLHFADALIRAGLNLTALILSVDFGYYPDGTLPRGLLEFNRTLDYWASYGLSLIISVSAPSSDADDPLAGRDLSISLSGWTPQRQQAWAAKYLPFLLAKPYVRGVLWSQLEDGRPHDFPNGGLFDRDGAEKPVLDTLAAVRRAYLK